MNASGLCVPTYKCYFRATGYARLVGIGIGLLQFSKQSGMQNGAQSGMGILCIHYAVRGAWVCLHVANKSVYVYRFPMLWMWSTVHCCRDCVPVWMGEYNKICRHPCLMCCESTCHSHQWVSVAIVLCGWRSWSCVLCMFVIISALYSKTTLASNGAMWTRSESYSFYTK